MATLIERNTYGTVQLYPSAHCEEAKIMASIQKRKTFTQADIDAWEKLGFAFTIHKLPE